MPLYLSIAFILTGGGLASTLIAARAGFEGFRPGFVGVILGGYYAGYIAGARFAPPAIRRVGHVRVFAGLAALASAAVLFHVLLVNPIAWMVFRGVVGMCLSALYVVCESWMNGVATNHTRGQLFATYMIVVSAAVLLGQILYAVVGFHGSHPFILAAILVSLSVVPIALAVYPSPPVHDPTPIAIGRVVHAAPLAAVGTFIAGFTTAAMLGAGVVYATRAHFNLSATGAFVGAALLGGILLQFPLGKWSDWVDRRLVLALTASVAAAVCVVASQVGTDRRLILIGLVSIAGGAGFPIYSLSSAHLNDYLDDRLIVAAGAHIILFNGLGAILGPIAGSIAIGSISPGALFIVLAVAYAVVGLYSLYRMTRRSPAAEAERAAFSLSMGSVTPESSVLTEDHTP